MREGGRKGGRKAGKQSKAKAKAKQRPARTGRAERASERKRRQAWRKKIYSTTSLQVQMEMASLPPTPLLADLLSLVTASLCCNLIA
jgi:hypothetical protein